MKYCSFAMKQELQEISLEYREKVHSSIADLSEVDEIHEGVEVGGLDVLQHEHRVLPRPHRLEEAGNIRFLHKRTIRNSNVTL